MINLLIVTFQSQNINRFILQRRSFSLFAHMYVLRMPIVDICACVRACVFHILCIGTIGCIIAVVVLLLRFHSSCFLFRVSQEKRDVLADPLSVSARFTFVRDTLFESRDIFRSVLSVSCKQTSF